MTHLILGQFSIELKLKDVLVNVILALRSNESHLASGLGGQQNPMAFKQVVFKASPVDVATYKQGSYFD